MAENKEPTSWTKKTRAPVKIPTRTTALTAAFIPVRRGGEVRDRSLGGSTVLECTAVTSG